MSTKAWLIGALLALGGLSGAPARADRPPGGIWKYAVPPGGLHGEFDNEDPIGLANGVHIPTDCSMNWLDDDGRLYCFTGGTSLRFFEQSPHAYLAAARRFFIADRAQGSQTDYPTGK